MHRFLTTTASLAMGLFAATAIQASSHREAPFIAGLPRVDGTDFYMFRSYEAGRGDFVTLIANYQPLQDSYGGPNYFAMDPDALYEIHVDNTGDSAEDLTFQFRFTNTTQGFAVNGNTGGGGPVNNPIPLINLPPTGATTPTLNRVETYGVKLVRAGRAPAEVTNHDSGSATFTKPVDNIGTKSIPDYEAYADQYVYNVDVPGCSAGGRLFVGQRREGFVVNLGPVFDLIHLNPLGARNSAATPEHPTGSIIDDKNVTSLALELPIACVTANGDPVIGAWTTASKRRVRVLNPNPAGTGETGRGASKEAGAWTQVSRLGSPLVNEVVIGITDKDKFNASEPKDDVMNFGGYVLYPTLPVLVNALFGVPAPTAPRSDLLAAFVTGITTGPNDTPASFKFTAPTNLTRPGEMLRLNTAIAAVGPGASGYSDLGFLGCDLAGFPNGRRVTDDVVDIELTVAEGALLGANGLQTCDLSGPAPAVKNPGAVVNDGALPNPADYRAAFPYLDTPIPGAN